MFQSATLIQSLNDSKLAERRRLAQSRRNPGIRRDAPNRIARPLARLISH